MNGADREGEIGAVDGVLDDPAWASLLGGHAHLAVRRGRAVRYRRDVSPFCALPSDATATDWGDMAALAGGDDVVLLAPPRALPSGWTMDDSLRGVQMVDVGVRAQALERAGPDGGALDGAVVLGPGHAEEMVALARATRPGPFESATYLTGRYLGVRPGGRLVAMAGERLSPPGWVEVSAVCTHPDARGRGLASALVRAVVAGVRSRGRRAFLYVESGNPAVSLYASLGLAVRRDVTLHVLRPPR